jgi:malonate decarboxylase epsilon subunit
LSSDITTFDTVKALKSTVAIQLAILTAGVATARVLRQEGIKPAALAGLSVGAFAAAVSAEVISLSEAVRLVRSRAEQMDHLYPAGYGMAAIVGLTERDVTTIVVTTSSDEAPVFVANINAPRQIVIAGATSAMMVVLQRARFAGAQKTEILDVPVPSHCPLLSSVSESLRSQLASIAVSDPCVPYLSNVTARAMYKAQDVANDLAWNISRSVRWFDATSVAAELGCKLFLEMPPGDTLSRLAKESIPDVNAFPVTRDFLKAAKCFSER